MSFLSRSLRLGVCALGAVSLVTGVAVAQTATTSIAYSLRATMDGQLPISPLMQASDGNLYGTLISGAETNDQNGGIYRFNPATSAYTLVHAFAVDGSEGYPSQSALTEGPDGNLYGVTSGGGANSNGTFYRYNLATSAFTVLTSFGSEVSEATDAPLLGSDGNFYINSEFGGMNANGSFVQITPAGVVTLLYSFPAGNPVGTVIETSPGTFYGILPSTGTAGEVYKAVVTGAAPNSTAVVTEPYTFTDTTQFLFGGFTVAPDGTLYTASTPQGDTQLGDIYKFNTGTDVLTTVFAFTTSNEATYGYNPNNPMFLGSDGNFYDLTNSDYIIGTQGDVLRITPAGVVTALFDGSSEQNNELQSPSTGVIQASDGNLYGQSPQGGAASKGDIIKTTFTPALAPPVKLTLSSSSVAAGTAVTLNWSVANAYSTTLKQCYAFVQGGATGAGTWTGKQTGSGTPYAGSASITPTAAGTYTYALTCGGSESGFATLTVTGGTSKAATTTTVSVSPNPVTAGAVATFTIHVTSATGTPTGTVTLTEGTTTYWTTGISGGNASYQWQTPVTPGSFPFTITYNGDSTHATSTATGTLVESKLAASIAPSANPSPVYAGQPVTLSATVTAANGHPTGTVTFAYQGSTVAGPLTLNSNGVATASNISTTNLPAGTYGLTATYSGDATYASGSAGFNEQIIVKTNTTTVGSASPNPVIKGQPVTLSATVKTASGTPISSGNVAFYYGSTFIASAYTNSSGVASTTLSSNITSGAYNLTAQYNPTGNYNGSSGNFTADIEYASTSTLHVSPTTFTAGTSVSLVDLVSNGSGADAAPGGAVTLYFALTSTSTGSSFSSIPLASGVASEEFDTTGLPTGTYYIYTKYAGDTHSSPSVSNRVAVTIQ